MNLSLKQRFSIPVISFGVVLIGLIIAVLSSNNMSLIRERVGEHGADIAAKYANRVKATLEVPMDSARALARALQGMVASGRADRGLAMAMLRQALTVDKNVLGVWTCWEPNAFDGKDRDYAGKPFHDSSGRFIPYFARSNGKVIIEPLAGYDKKGTGDYYQLAKNSGEEQILEPFKYTVGGKKILMTTVAVPIKVNGKIVGVFGYDIALQSIQKIVQKIKPYKKGVAALFANQGTVTAHFDPRRIGKNMKESEKDMSGDKLGDFYHAVKSGNPYSFYSYSAALKTDILIQSSPFVVGHSTTPWSLTVGIPMNIVMASAWDAVYGAVVLGLIGIVLLGGAVLFIAVRISRNVEKTSANLAEASRQVSASSQQMLSASTTLAEQASESSSSLEETSASLEEITATIKANADNAVQANKLTEETRQAAVNSGEIMGNMLELMNRITQASDETAGIIKTIDELAFQTNLLALNAAIEAARAGDAGSGFAVVAEEVRSLAAKSAAAAKETGERIQVSQDSTREGMEVSQQVAQSLEIIIERVQQVSGLVNEVTSASNEQSKGIDQINTAVAEMNQGTQAIAASAEETSSSSEELSAQSEELNNMVIELNQLTGFKSVVQQQKEKQAPLHFNKQPVMQERTGLIHHEKEYAPDQVVPLQEGDY